MKVSRVALITLFLLSAGFFTGGCFGGGNDNQHTVSAPDAPTGITVSGGDGQMTINWAPVTGATSYNMYWSLTSGVTPANGNKIAGITAPHTQTGLTNGTTYYVIVAAVGPGGESEASNEVSVTPIAGVIPSAPTGVSATGENGQITIVWSPATGATSYNLYWSNTSGVTPSNGSRVSGISSPYTITGLTNGTTYYGVMTAVGPGGESGPSSEVNVTPLFTVMVPGDYSTIQAAIDGVPAGSGIRITTATHTEGGQIVINKNVTIVSTVGSESVIKPATNLTQTNTVAGAWLLVNPNVTFNLRNVALDGNGLKVWQAVRSHGITTISGVYFRNIGDSANPYVGFAIASFGGTVPGGAGSDTHGAGGASSTITVTNCTFQDIGRIGILVKGTSSTATISENRHIGKGLGNYLDYAFEVGAGGNATIIDNIISNNRGVATSDGSTSAGILVTDYYGTGTHATIIGNTISNSTDGIAVGYDATDASVVVAHYNKFGGNVNGIYSTHPIVDAINNWWGNASGPTHTSNPGGTGNGVSDNVTFNPWCTVSSSCNQ